MSFNVCTARRAKAQVHVHGVDMSLKKLFAVRSGLAYAGAERVCILQEAVAGPEAHRFVPPRTRGKKQIDWTRRKSDE